MICVDAMSAEQRSFDPRLQLLLPLPPVHSIGYSGALPALYIRMTGRRELMNRKNDIGRHASYPTLALHHFLASSSA